MHARSQTFNAQNDNLQRRTLSWQDVKDSMYPYSNTMALQSGIDAIDDANSCLLSIKDRILRDKCYHINRGIDLNQFVIENSIFTRPKHH